MSTDKLVRWGGLAVFLGSVLWGIQKIGWQLFIGTQDPSAYPEPAATILWVMGLGAALFILLGLPALYACQAKQAGALGLIAFVEVFIGMVLVAGNAYFGTFVQPGLVDLISHAEGAGVTVQEPAAAAVGFLLALGLYTLGWLLFGLISLKARQIGSISRAGMAIGLRRLPRPGPKVLNGDLWQVEEGAGRGPAPGMGNLILDVGPTTAVWSTRTWAASRRPSPISSPSWNYPTTRPGERRPSRRSSSSKASQGQRRPGRHKASRQAPPGSRAADVRRESTPGGGVAAAGLYGHLDSGSR